MTRLITFEGEARSGKGTSVRAVRGALQEAGRNVFFIDQGQKFRAFARLALDRNVPLEDQSAIGKFLDDPAVRDEMLELLKTVSSMEQPEIDALLYTQEIATGAAQIGMNPRSQHLLVDVLFDQVRNLVADDKPDVILIDGRDMANKARKMAEEGIAEFLLGFYFRCDTAIAARRTEGIFVEMGKMNVDEKLQLLDAITRISDRNRQDALRSVHPMREPANAYPLHTADFRVDDEEYVTQAAKSALASGVVSIDTSYTRSVQEMTGPVMVLTTRALELQSD